MAVLLTKDSITTKFSKINFVAEREEDRLMLEALDDLVTRIPVKDLTYIFKSINESINLGRNRVNIKIEDYD